MASRKKITTEKFVENAISIHWDFWHGNPKKYNSKDINCKNKKSFGKLYEATFEKENILINHGYKIISIWENEWNKEKEYHV